ncbi:MAG: hypothetical protein F9K13_07305 [Candidatus Methylomirabilis oxygeniifera]|uniref:Uncharacterized protein n=1 Tax=Methylomirabilis oxygeniifera TaxID=671143 RepID=D5ML53_METO1|nr:MAG: hypothetical protein F9K13_07305 [Candidatus Methylomirabilis oxyfera]CBE69895.1 exported protein of unknown function [Candidatus Methylomirabilis oxyfera]
MVVASVSFKQSITRWLGIGIALLGTWVLAPQAVAQEAPAIVWQQQAFTVGSAIGISRDGSTLVASGNEIMVLDPATGEVRLSIPNKAEAIAVSPAGDVIAAAQVTKDPDTGWWTASRLDLYETSDGSVRETMNEHKWQIWALAFSADAARLVSGDMMAELKLWDLASDSVIYSWPLQNGSVAFSPDGKYLVSNGQNSYARMYDTGTFTLKRAFLPWSGDRGVAFTPDGAKLVTSGSIPGGVDGVPTSAAIIKVFRASDGVLLKAIKIYDNGGQQVRAFALSVDGKYAAISLYSDQIRIYRLSDGALMKQYTVGTADVNGLAFTPDGMGLAYIRADGMVVMTANPVAPATPLVPPQAPLVPAPTPPTPPTPEPGPAVPQALTELRVSPEAVVGGQSATGTVVLAGPAPDGGQLVNLMTTNLVVSVPATITVPGGSTAAGFTITTLSVSAPVEGLIRASTSVGE